MNPNNRPKALKLIDDIIRKAVSYGCRAKVETVVHKTSFWPLLRIVDACPGLNNGTLLITTGIHGTEVTGPLTIQQRFPEILACARVAGLRLVAYPLINPSGWDKNTDLNADGDGGDENSNNDYLRYQKFDGSWTWKLPDDCRGWHWSSDPAVGQRLPAETAAMHEFLKKEDWPNVKIALDIHQDNLTQGAPAGAYQYIFGNASRYSGIIDQIRKLTNVLGDRDFQFDRNDPTDVRRWDKNGCLVFHDGSISDLAYRIGVRDSLTIETTGATELQTAIGVNMTWIRGLCELAGK